ncbi:hypothetical protein NM208_g2330 [Fusarium decemcellulare]|uniref:Uncharacterized protein n=1 Tax=Fusarium decemcellulare TaxID=57161 RepID=A0ACC1STB9_9HYPO|nr:hypothetical protein NM208_g2330 [Fusarium decemcellulare]
MAGASTSDSRLGVTLQGFDQVIALSQANINESLTYHFSNKPELYNFNATVKSTRESLKGTLKAPRIELIDVDGADQALYCLEFAPGKDYYDQPDKYVAPKFIQWVADDNGDDEDAPPAWRKIEKPAEGWKIAFFVDFSLKKMAQVPQKIRDQIQNPGSYSVDQLLVDFGTAEIISLAPERTVVTGFSTPEEEDAVKGSISVLVSKWLVALKGINNSGSHNVLGYAVKADNAAAIPKSAPSFPPTSVRLQTINYRPDGDASKSTSDHDHNAFLFTEMTELRQMPTTDLQWSGDWFYESIGGTMVMSRRVFWERFLLEKLKVTNQALFQAAKKVVNNMATHVLADRIDFPSVSSDWTTVSGTKAAFSWSSGTQSFSYEEEVPGSNNLYDFTWEASVQNQVEAQVGGPNISVNSVVSAQGHLSIHSYGLPKALYHIVLDANVSGSSPTDIQIRQVDDGGKLKVTVWTPQTNSSCSTSSDLKGLLENWSSRSETILNNSKKEFWDDVLAGVIAKAAETTRDLEKPLEEALNGQGAFIFPGGGTFEMKSPIFNKAGDLMIGLVFNSGNAVSDAVDEVVE